MYLNYIKIFSSLTVSPIYWMSIRKRLYGYITLKHNFTGDAWLSSVRDSKYYG